MPYQHSTHYRNLVQFVSNADAYRDALVLDALSMLDSVEIMLPVLLERTVVVPVLIPRDDYYG